MTGNQSRMMIRGMHAPWRTVMISVMVSLIMACPFALAQEPPPAPAGIDLDEVISKAMRAMMTGQPPTADPVAEPPETGGEAAVGAEGGQEPASAGGRPAAPVDIRVSPDGRVEMHVRELDLATVLQMLAMQSRRNIVATRNVSGTVSASLYDVTFDEAMTAILASNGCGWREQASFIYVYTNEELAQMAASSRQVATRIFRLRYVRASDVQTLIQPLLSEVGKIAMTPEAAAGIASNAEEAGGNTLSLEDCLLVIDHEENLDAIAELIASIDTRPQQVLVEATLLRARLNEENALGIDFDFVGGVDFEMLGATSPAVSDLTLGELPPERLDYTSFAARTDLAGAVPAGGFTFGIIKNSVAGFIRALEQVTDTTVVANPKVLALNKQRGEVIVGQRDGYLTTTVTETAAIQNVEFLETGTQLIFRPFIGDDGYIRMEIHPKDSTGGLTGANLPSEQTTEVTTNIIVRDGHTILIGGLFREVTRAGRGQVPLLGNVPIAGALFRRTRDEIQREEVIILLTVRLIKNDDLLSKESYEAAQDIERYRVGMREGMQWFGRERLGQAHYHWAVQHAAAGNLSQALWDVDLAINNSPSLLPAIRLKEELLGRRAWDEPGSAVRGFLSRQIMKQQGLVRPEFGRPAPPFDFPALLGPNGFDDGPAAGTAPVNESPDQGGSS